MAALRRPADNTTGIEINDDGEIGEALTGSDIGDLRDPGGVWSRDVELPVERIVYGDGRPAAVDAGTAFVANLRLYPSNACQASDPVRAAHLALVEKIVVQLSIAVDLAALFPCLQEQIGQSLVLTGPPAQRVLQPGVNPTGMNPQEAAHRPHRKLQAMQGIERVLHFASLAKYAVALFWISRSSVTRAISFFSRLISSASSLPLALDAENFFFHS